MPSGLHAQRSPCGERACPRWSAQRSQPRRHGVADEPRRPVLGLLRSPTRASSLATGFGGALALIGAVGSIADCCPASCHAQRSSCGERACPRWSAQHSQPRRHGVTAKPRPPVLGLLRSPTRASSLATGFGGALALIGAVGSIADFCPANCHAQRSSCGERACPRWSAQRSQPRRHGVTAKPRRPVLVLLRSPTRASSLATGFGGALALIGAVTGIADCCPANCHAQRSSCGERACPRWSAQRSHPRRHGVTAKPRRPVLGLLRSPTRASSLATEARLSQKFGCHRTSAFTDARLPRGFVSQGH